jgi:hypothetical protein
MLVFSAVAAVFGPLAHAAPRRIVVVNLAADGAAGEVATAKIRADLARRPELDPLASGLLAAALEERLPALSPEQEIVAGVQQLLREAREAYATRGAHEEAFDSLKLAQSRLVRVPPTPEVRALWAEISIELGVVALAKQDRAESLDSFRLARAFDPNRTDLDPAIYDPEVIKVYAEAGKPRANTASLSVSTDYDDATLWVDGVEVAGRTVALTPGKHIVTVAYPDHRTAGQRVTVVDGPAAEVSLPLERLPVNQRAEAMRRRLLADLSPPDVFLDAARDAATLTGLETVVVVRSTAPGTAEAALWDRERDKLGHWLPITGKKSITRLLTPLLPRTGPVDGNGRLIIPPPPPPPKKWWERTDVRIGGAAAVVLGVGLTAIIITSSGTPGMVPTCIGSFDPSNC